MIEAPWLSTGVGFPEGGLSIEVEYRTGNRSSRLHLPDIGDVIAGILKCEKVFDGSLNFWADHDVEFPEPAHALCAGSDWIFAPVVIQEAAVGIAARRLPLPIGRFIEVFACRQLAPQLDLTPGTRLTIRLLRGAYLGLAA